MMRHSRALGFIAGFIYLVFAAAAATSAQMITPTDTGLGGQNKITGMVLSPDGQRLPRVSVKLVTESRGERIAISDDSGNFAFTGLVNGDYTLLIEKEKDYETYTSVVTIRQRRGFNTESILVNIRLNPRKGSGYKPGVINAQFANVPKHALELYEKGVELGKKGDRKGAIEKLQNAVAEYDKFLDAYNEMGAQYLALGDLEHAADAFQTALRIDQKAFGAMTNLGMTLFLMKKYPEADIVLRAAIDLKNDQPVPHYFLGQNSAYQGRFDDAVKELNEAVRLGGAQMAEAHRLLAIIYASKGEKSKAADAIAEYLKLNPKAADADALKKKMEELRKPN